MCHYHKIINNDNLDTICNECKTGSRGCVQCKKELINNMTEFLKDYREKRSYSYWNKSENKKWKNRKCNKNNILHMDTKIRIHNNK